MKRTRMVAGIALVAAVGAGGVAGAVLGVPSISGAQTFPNRAIVLDATTPTVPGHPMSSPLLDAAAKALGLTTQQLRDKLSDGKTTIADVAKQQNVDLSKVIAAMVAADQSRINGIVNNPLPKFAGPGGPGGPAGLAPFGRPAFRGGIAGFGPVSASIDDIAKALGITTDQLKTDLKNGQSIADIAKSKNLDLNTVINTLVGDADARIDQAVKNGKLTQDQGTNLKSMVKTAITNLVNNGFPRFGGRMGGRGFFGKPGGGAPSTVSPPTTAKPPTS